MSSALVLWILVVPVLAAAASPAPRVVARTGLALGSTVAASLALLVVVGLDADAGSGLDAGAWLDLRVDRVAALLLVSFSLLAAIVSVHAGRGFDAGDDAVAFQHRLALLVAGAGLVVIAGGPVPLILGWLLSSWALTRLVAGWIDTPRALDAVARLHRTLAVSDAALVLAVLLAVGIAGPEITALAPGALADLADTDVAGVAATHVVATLLAIAGAARSTVLPFHRWLTATLYAPTPVSAIVHAGFVAGAGVLLVRFAPVVAGADVVLVLLGAAAIATIVLGTAASLSRPDAKGALAWSTVAQMAFMVVQAVVGGFAAATVHIVGHGMYKAAQFLGVGETVATALRTRRRPRHTRPTPASLVTLLGIVVPTSAVTLGVLVGPAPLSDAEYILLAAFVWFSLAGAVRGVLRAGTLSPAMGAIVTFGGSLVAAVAYFGSLRVVKAFLDPAIADVEVDPAVAVSLAIATVVSVALLALVVTVPGLAGRRAAMRWWIDRLTGAAGSIAPIRPPANALPGGVAPTRDQADVTSEERRSTLRAQVNRAAEVVAPSWPLSSFVAVNPLTGLERLDFDRAGVEASALRGRIYRPLDEYRADHVRGVTADADLAWAILEVAPVACALPAVAGVSAERIVTADVLHGPDAATAIEPRTELERRIGLDNAAALGLDDLVAGWALDHLAPPSWPIDETDRSFWSLARDRIVRHARRSLGTPAVTFAERLDADPLDAIDKALDRCGVRPSARVDELRGLLASVRGIAAIARWRTEWAGPDETVPVLRVAEVAAARAVLDAVVLIDLEFRHGGGPTPSLVDLADTPAIDTLTLERAAAVAADLDLPDDHATIGAVADVLTLVPDPMRQAVWQRAQERRFDHDALTILDRVDPGDPSARPATQSVWCIDVRSEGIRRHLESTGVDETLGFAGFFGVPMEVRELGWSEPEARCPVLVNPTTVATEAIEPDASGAAGRLLAPARRLTTAGLAHKATKVLPGAPFAAAEATGVFSALRAARRTFAPARHDHGHDHRPTVVHFDTEVGLDQRLFWAESVLRTMGLTERFARLVVLTGHTSHTTNNAHATALECGACAGAGGAVNARAVATLLNDPDVRAGLSAREITIPDDTWFTAAIHDTASDVVTLLDAHLVPPSHTGDLHELDERLAEAGRRQSASRARTLPGDAGRVRDRGHDWAQPRPEWGLATNGAFVIAPRSATAGLDLGGRAFLHSYDATQDPDGAVLEAIMTAPLVVGHWISAQYYFSTVDPDVFGAGDKLLHNPVGSLGVLLGAGGDLRVGLPLQSTHVAGRAHHQPLRLLAVIQADLVTIEKIIARNPVLSRLVEGSWMRVAARSHPHEPWSIRSRHGSWSTEPRDVDPETSMEIT